MRDGVSVPFTPEEEVEWDAKEAEWLASRPPAYIAQRQSAYLPLAEQLDMQYHDQLNATTTWVDHIASVKAQFTKVQ
jgi:hypothetical protein